jgi:hypothetical protein
LSIAFDDDVLKITSATDNIEVDLDYVKSWTFSDVTFEEDFVDGVDTPKSADMSVVVTPDFIKISGLEATSALALYDLAGRCLVRKECGVEAQLSLTELPHGVYLVNVNGKTFKINK